MESRNLEIVLNLVPRHLFYNEGTVVNRALISLHRGSLQITLTVLLTGALPDLRRYPLHIFLSKVYQGYVAFLSKNG